MSLDEIGFYTLTDARILELVEDRPSLKRCELILTNACNFSCPYCRGMQEKDMGTISFEEAKTIVDGWCDDGLSAIRFSGGEPTLIPWLDELVEHTKSRNPAMMIAISTNGSADRSVYERLLDVGVNDFSVSLDGCCASTCDTMSGGEEYFDVIVDNIRFLSTRSYVTVGVVLTDTNMEDVEHIVTFASNLGVSDIRIISAAQDNKVISDLYIDPITLSRHPILRYRYNRIKNQKHVRGIESGDCNKCPLVLDDIAVLKGHHYPCVIYMREWGDPIGKVGGDVRGERRVWYESHNTHEDPICKKNCLDVCIDYNNAAYEVVK